MPNQKIYPDGSKSFVLKVTSAFVDADATGNGAKAVKWKDVTAGIAIVSSDDPDFDKAVKGGVLSDNITHATKDYVGDALTEKQFVDAAEAQGPLLQIPPPGFSTERAFSAYGNNFEWAKIAMGCVTLKAPATNGGSGTPGSDPYDPPIWALKDDSDIPYEGTGVKIGIMGELPSLHNNGTTPATSAFSMHPEFDFYRAHNKTGTVITEESALTGAPYHAIFTEDPASDETDALGGVVAYSVIHDDLSLAQPKQKELYSGITYLPNGNGGVTRFDRVIAPPPGGGLTIGNDTTPILGILCGRGTGLVTDNGGVANDGTTDEPIHVENSQFPERDGVSYIAADATYNQRGPFFGPQYKATWSGATTYGKNEVVDNGAGTFYRSLADANLNNAVTDTNWWEVLDYTQGNATYLGEWGGVVGRMRGLAPAAKVICYANYSQQPFGIAGIQFPAISDFVRVAYLAIDHKVQILGVMRNWIIGGIINSVPSVADAREILGTTMRDLAAAGVVVVATSFFDARIRKSNGGEGEFFLGRENNLITANGTGPRGGFNFLASDLNKYVPQPARSPQPTVDNLDRVQQMWLRLANGFVTLGGAGTSPNQDVDVAAPTGSHPTDFMREISPLGTNEFDYSSLLYTCSARDFGPVGISPINYPTIQAHGYTGVTPIMGAQVAAAVALVLEAYKRKNSSFPTSYRKAINVVRKTAEDTVGPAADLFFGGYAPGNLYAKNLVARTDHVLLINNQGIGVGGFPGVVQDFFAILGLLGDQQSFIAEDFPGDRGGRDDVYGHGRIQILKAIQEVDPPA